MLILCALCPFIAIVPLAYGRVRDDEPSPRERLAWRLIILGGAAAGVATMALLRLPTDEWMERSFVRRLATPVPIACGAVYLSLALVALVPPFRRSAAFERMRPWAWGMMLMMGGVVGGISMQLLDYEITRFRSQEVRNALHAFHAGRGHYPSRLDELVPGWLSEVPQARAGWRSPPFVYESAGADYRLSFASS